MKFTTLHSRRGLGTWRRETWSWDESLFAGTARYYEQGRTPYAPGLADAFARSLALDGQGRLLDSVVQAHNIHGNITFG